MGMRLVLTYNVHASIGLNGDYLIITYFFYAVDLAVLLTLVGS